MQSSPPRRAWDPPSPATSQYSIDLAALESHSRSAASTPLPTPQVDQVLSEDIDGPSDFTQNLEMWMRGGSMQGNTLKSGLESLKETCHEGMDEQLLTPKRSGDTEEDHNTTSHHTPINSPPRESPFGAGHMSAKDVGAEERSSEWHPNIEAQTPHLQAKRKLLQPTVEDHYSELNLARTPSAHVQNAGPGAEVESKNEILKTTAGRLPSPSLSPELVAMPQKRRSSTYERDNIEQQVLELQAKCQQLEEKNAALRNAVEEGHRVREADSARYEAQLAEAARREKDLVEMKDQSQVHREDFRREFAELKEQVQLFKTQQAAGHQVKDVPAKHVSAELKEMKAQLAAQKSDHEQDVSALEQEIELERRGRNDAEETVKAHREELDECQTQNTKMKIELQQGEELREQIKEQLRHATMDNERLRLAEPSVSEDQKRSAEQLQLDMKDAKQQLKDQQDAHERLRSSQPTVDVSSELDELRTKLNEATIERDELQDKLTAEAAEKEEAQEKISDMKAINAILDVKISEGVKKREKHWNNRVAKMQAERKVMSKLILRLWGQEEVGMQDEAGWQKYEYMFNEKELKSKSK